MSYANSSEYEDAAINLLFGGNPQQALELFEEGLRKFPEEQGLCLGRGMALNALKRPAEAREIFLQLNEKHPSLTDALQGLAEAELALGNKEAAAAAARKACDYSGEQSADFCHCLGLILYRHRLFADAEYCYRRAVAIDRAHGDSWLGLAASLHQQGRRDEAIVLLKEAVADRLPGFWEAYSYLGCMLFDAGQGEEAKKVLGRIPLDELRDPAAVERLRQSLAANAHPERARVLREIQARARAAQDCKPEAEEASGQKPDIVAIGDLHGRMDALIEILRYGNLLDTAWDSSWIAKDSIVVQTGDVIDRGGDSEAVYDALGRLQDKAQRAGGKIVRLIGNHELYVLQGEFRATNLKDPASFRKKLVADILAGVVQGAFSAQGFLFTHAGVRSDILRSLLSGSETTSSDRVASCAADAINRVLVAAVQSDDWSHPIFHVGISRGGRHRVGGVFWADCKELFDSARASTLRQVLGHTRGDDIQFDDTGRLVDIDVGMVFGRPYRYVRIRNGKLRALTVKEGCFERNNRAKMAKLVRPQPAKQDWLGTFIVGPVRGDYGNLLKMLQHIGIVDAGGKWQGRAAGLVAIGPFLGKGRGKLTALRYLERLAGQARRLKAGYVELVKTPNEEVKGHSFARILGDEWLVTASGISGPALAKAWVAARAPYAGGGPYRPPVLTVLCRFLEKDSRFLDGVPGVDTDPFQLINGQICGATGEPKARVEWAGETVARLDSGLGYGIRLLFLRNVSGKWEEVELPLAQERFLALKKHFAKTFGMGFPTVLEPDPEREPLHFESDGILAISRAAKQDGVLLPAMPDNFQAAPIGTWMTGEWGYGANSYAFYFVRKDARREVFLRLFYGGAYGKPEQDAVRVREFLQRYVAFEEWAAGNLERWSIENNMGDCTGWIERRGGSGREDLGNGLVKEFRFPNEC